MSISLLGRMRRGVFAMAQRPIRWFLELAMRDGPTLHWLLHSLGNSIAMDESTILNAKPLALDRIRGFEDCAWLYSSNPLNHGFSRLRFDEAAYLFRLVREMGSPSCVEIGRYKGGTTVLLAAAGARVLSLDNGGVPGQQTFTESTRKVLRELCLDDMANVLISDALEYKLDTSGYDLVILDHGVDDFELAERLFEYWWPAVKKGGVFLFRDGKETVLHKTAEFVSSLRNSDVGRGLSFDVPGAFVLCRK